MIPAQVDLWSNEHIRADPHYTQADGASEFMSHHQARARQIEENIKIIDTADIGEVFMKNMYNSDTFSICVLSVSLTPKVSLFQVGAPRHREQAGRRAAQDVHG